MKFFVLDPLMDGDAVTDFLPVPRSPVGAAPRCPVCGRFIGMLPLVPPVRVSLEAWGHNWGDLAFDGGDDILVSWTFKKRFFDAELLGFTRFEPIEVVGFRAHERRLGAPPRYELASIARSRAVIDDDASDLVREHDRICAECCLDGTIRRAARVVIKPGTWSGEDIFFARGLPGTILATERLKNLCEQHGLRNCPLVPADQFAFPRPKQLNRSDRPPGGHNL